ncbi:hypothetical protein RQP46_007397 [Phenoliferia psychrophenolica]
MRYLLVFGLLAAFPGLSFQAPAPSSGSASDGSIFARAFDIAAHRLGIRAVGNQHGGDIGDEDSGTYEHCLHHNNFDLYLAANLDIRGDRNHSTVVATETSTTHNVVIVTVQETVTSTETVAPVATSASDATTIAQLGLQRQRFGRGLIRLSRRIRFSQRHPALQLRCGLKRGCISHDTCGLLVQRRAVGRREQCEQCYGCLGPVHRCCVVLDNRRDPGSDFEQ